MGITVGNDAHAVCPSRWNYSNQALSGVTVLAVSSDDAEHRALEGLFDHTRWVLHHARSLQEALAELDRDPSPVILISQKLPDGDWNDLIDHIPETPDAPRVIVTTPRLSPTLYEQVFEHGAFDIVARPFKAAQLYPIISDAWRQWKCSAGRALVATA